MLLLSLSPLSFPSFKSTTLSCLSLVFFRQGFECEATLCHVVVAHCAHPRTPYSPIPNLWLSDGDIKVLLEWEQNVLSFCYLVERCDVFLQLVQQKTQEESFCFWCCPIGRGIFGQLHSLISLFSLVSFTVKIFQLTATVSHPQTSKWTQGRGWKIYNKLWGTERASEVHNIKSRCVSSVTAAG